MRAFVLFVSVIFVPFLVRSQNIEQIVTNHYAASGQDLWKEIKSVSIEGVWFKGRERLPFLLSAKKPDKIAVRGTKDEDAYVEATNGKESWTIAPWTGSKKPQLMLDEESLILAHLFSFGSYIDEESVLEYQGEVEVNGIAVYWLKEQRSQDMELDFYIDVEDYLLRRMNIRKRIGTKTIPYSQTVDQYRKYGPFNIPATFHITSGSLEREYVFDEIVIGDGIPNDVFERPVKD